MYKRLLKILITLALSLFALSAAADSGIKLYINDVLIPSDVAPVIVNDRTLVPVRCIFEAFSADVSWSDETKQVIINSGGNKIILTIDNKRAYFNNEIVTLDAAPVIINDRTLVPVRFISEKLGYSVVWDEGAKSVKIYSPQTGDTKKATIITEVKAAKTADSTTVTIYAENFEKPTVSTAQNPSRYIMDFPNAVLKDGDKKIRFNQNKDISEIRYAQHGGYARVVIESASDAKYTPAYADGFMTVTVVGTASVNDTKPVIKTDKPIVVIDAGHGGWDTGALGKNESGAVELRECDANLAIAKKVQYYLQSAGISVVMTRSTDTALGDTEMADLLERSAIANTANATLFVSIHNNSFTNPEASGTMVLYADTDNKGDYGVTSKQLAQNILAPLVGTMQLLNRGVVDSPKMVVLRKTDMPSVLIECGFVSCPTDRAILRDEGRIDGIANAIASGIGETLGMIK